MVVGDGYYLLATPGSGGAALGLGWDKVGETQLISWTKDKILLRLDNAEFADILR